MFISDKNQFTIILTICQSYTWLRVYDRKEDAAEAQLPEARTEPHL